MKDPLEYAQVLTDTRPDELPVGVLPEPVDAADPRRLRYRLAHREPIAKIIADVIAAKRQHREGIAAHFADGAGRGGSRLGAHRRGLINAFLPGAGFDHEWHGIRTSGTENECGNRHARRVIPFGIERGTLRRGDGETCIRMRSLPPAVRRP